MDNFISDDQKIMASAENYNRYLFSLIKPYLNGEVIEIGSGIGNITRQMLETPSKISKLFCIEPDESCINSFKAITSQSRFPIQIIKGSFPETYPSQTGVADLIFSFNVLEHIKDDNGALFKSFELLKSSGYLFIYVPAFQCLFGSMDKRLNHYRRYSKIQLSKKLQSIGFKLIKCEYTNFVGFWAWLINNRIFKIKSQKPGQVKIFDNYILPIQIQLEKYIRFPIGQNLYIIAQKML
ncbi:MAG TPA: hypothetical protein DD381_02795 [Lentisphaeria bacterium]|nr:MAG: hypothetical protein A2X47_03460 [Lentisphaerae bacterium GWF2_38_69]HBM15263.1 hypothetical protein [Lentisphaeria bacterium]